MVDSLTLTRTEIPGLLVLRIPLHRDPRGWFKENWQRMRMTDLGLPDFGPVQHSVAQNGPAGTTRGVHAEPWDKLVSVAAGEAFGAWVDLRTGAAFGTVHTQRLDVETAVFVPRGVGNAYQTLTPDTVYSYLVNAHWKPDASYTHLNLADPSVAIDWPIPLSEATISEKDRSHPQLDALTPASGPETLILGGSGQLGRALQQAFPSARDVTWDELDVADAQAVAAFDVGDADLVINAAAYTAVDAAETEGRSEAWATNATGVAALARSADEQRFRLVHYSTDYVFDGLGGSGGYTEQDTVRPLSVYGQSKAAGDIALSTASRHYLLRTSWVVGDGANFVATMRRLAREGRSPSVVTDQIGRLTVTSELARATAHLLRVNAPYGTYNVSGGGAAASWAEIARAVFVHEGRDPDDVVGVTTEQYAASAAAPTAPRPPRSVLNLAKLQDTGFEARDQWESLATYLEELDSRAF